MEPFGCPEALRVRVVRAGTVVELACETNACAGASFTTFHLPLAEIGGALLADVRGMTCARFNGVLLPLSSG